MIENKWILVPTPDCGRSSPKMAICVAVQFSCNKNKLCRYLLNLQNAK
jgi:hypothetical protein